MYVNTRHVHHVTVLTHTLTHTQHYITLHYIVSFDLRYVTNYKQRCAHVRWYEWWEENISPAQEAPNLMLHDEIRYMTGSS